ncbi:MAG: ATP-grasp domain-containing protein [Pirellulaceae bacterium]
MPRLTILGASARAAAFSAARAGFEPYAIDLFADRDLAQRCPAVRIERYPRDFLRALAAAPEAPWIYTGGLENYPRLVDRLAKVRALWGNSGDVLGAVRDPWKMARALGQAGFAYPALATGEAGTLGFGSAIVKPLRSSAGLGVRLATAADRQNARPGASKQHFLQEFIAGESGSAAFVAAGGKATLLGTTRQLLGRDWGHQPEFLYVGSIGPWELRPGEREKLTKLGKVLSRAFRLVGLFGVDFVRTPDEIWTVEVNPRYTASVEVLERLTDQHFLALHAAACQSGLLPEQPPASSTNQCAGKAIIYARQAIAAGPQFHQSHASYLADIPAAGQHFEAGQPVATVLATAASTTAVEALLRRRAAAVLESLNT